MDIRQLLQRVEGGKRPTLHRFGADGFRVKLDAALLDVRKSLDASRNPQFLGDVPHSYADKFATAELVTRAALATQLETLCAGFGLTADVAQQLLSSRGDKTVTLRYKCSTQCAFLRTTEREEASASRHEKQGPFGTTTFQSVTTIYEHFWEYTVAWSILVFTGADTAGATEIAARTGKHVILTTGREPSNPLAPNQVLDPLDVEITWLLDALADGADADDFGSVGFHIQRSNPTTCHTPRRNAEVDVVIINAITLVKWASDVRHQVESNCRDGYKGKLPAGVEVPNMDIMDSEMFAPVAVMLAMEAQTTSPQHTHASTFSKDDFRHILDHARNTLTAKLKQFEHTMPATGVITPLEARLVLCARHSMVVWREYVQSIEALEALLMKQLVAAIGKHIGPKDFAEYMEFHSRHLLRPNFLPQKFCYSVRLAGRCPEGTLSLEKADSQPVPTTCLHKPHGHRMTFSLSAETQVAFEGEHFVHSMMFHKFSDCAPPALSVIARARQFSSFILMAGTLSSADVFQPEHAILIQNKDEVKIPLILETIPAPKEFRDAIESLSPEQQAFCKAYRKMQLAGSLFAVAVVPVKPQLERLLNLPSGSLIKEVKMCQDLMLLFVEYQIPSDLLAYSGSHEAAVVDQVDAVKQHVAAIQSLLDAAKAEELQEEQRRAAKDMNPFDEPSPTAAKKTWSRPSKVGADSLDDIFAQVENVKQVLSQNIDSLLERGERLDSLQCKSEMLSAASHSFGAIGASFNASGEGGAASDPFGDVGSGFTNSASIMDDFQQTSQDSFAASDRVGSAGNGAHAQNHSTPSPTTGTPSKVQSQSPKQLDYTKLPGKLDANLDSLAIFQSVRTTKIKLSNRWMKSSQRGLLSKPIQSTVLEEHQRAERCRAFDLLDALSKSGALALKNCTLHLVMAATHVFDLDLLHTIAQDNINPIARVEMSELILASTIFSIPPEELVIDSERERVKSALHLET